MPSLTQRPARRQRLLWANSWNPTTYTNGFLRIFLTISASAIFRQVLKLVAMRLRQPSSARTHGVLDVVDLQLRYVCPEAQTGPSEWTDDDERPAFIAQKRERHDD